ncbi:monovalent cation:proton antiporter-2 (CPA2) family protein [Arenicella sp. 4NH20-0111]|uniref:monovalent cation:proton antiporter-2 (CPA2) family protein n=1 Tax=Arenicella sp. 4NH20-0111 TaxID=3127648 RepID=UPI003103DD9B
MNDLLIESFVFLAAAVIAVPLSKKLGLGSVLGYLIAGIVIGPMIGLVGEEAQDIQHVAEFGVVMMLFLVGLELEPEKLWSLRHRLFGLGGLQVGITAGVCTLVALIFQLPWTVSIAIGLVISLSSTAIVLQTLNERGLMSTQGGQSTFSVLLFQDIAVIPMLALVPLLALPELANTAVEGHHQTNLISHLPGWLKAIVTLSAIGFIVVGGTFLSKPIFRYIANARLQEIFTAFALMLVVGIAALMNLIGLSPALGTFLAGVVLANSEYRHELESNLEPFKGLLLGLFFITVGAGVDFELLFAKFGTILGLTLCVIAVKAVVLLILGKLFRLKGVDQWLFALGLAQAGEFGFVLLSFMTQNAVLPTEIADQLLLIIALSMLLTPLLFIVLDKVIFPKLASDDERDMDEIDEHRPIILAGHGRFGQIVSRLLMACDHHPTIIDLDVVSIEGFSKFGIKTYFGDASRPEMLEAAGISKAKLLVVAIDDKERAIKTVSIARKLNPNLPILARSYDRPHTYDLYSAGATSIVRETFDSAVRTGRLALEKVGVPSKVAHEVSGRFFDLDRAGVAELASLHDPKLPRFANEKAIEVALRLRDEMKDELRSILAKN